MQQHSTPAVHIISSNSSYSTQTASEVDESIRNELNASAACKAFDWDSLFGNLKEDQIQVKRQESWFQIGGYVSKQYDPFCDWVDLLTEVITSFTQLSTRVVREEGLGNTLFLNTPGYADGEISVGNIGFVRDPNCEGGIVKQLDFDLSKQIGSISMAPHWTGTLPFMSIELLENTNTEHQLGFDVEALLWTLLWIVQVYVDGEEAHGKEEHPLIKWFTNRYSPGIIANIKAAYLERFRPEGYTTEWCKELEPEMNSLVKIWRSMRRDLEDKRSEESNELLLPDSIYGAEGFQKIETWMADKRWNEPRKSCSCHARCTET